MIRVTWCFKRILATVEFTAIAPGGNYEINTELRYVLQLILCFYDLILHLCVYLHFSQLQMASFMVSVYMFS